MDENERVVSPSMSVLIRITQFWNLLSDAARYLPTDTVLTDDGQLRPPAPVHCFLGPHSHQTRVEMAMFDSHAICMLLTTFADVCHGYKSLAHSRIYAWKQIFRVQRRISCVGRRLVPDISR
jgi:hypothetical protein